MTMLEISLIGVVVFTLLSFGMLLWIFCCICREMDVASRDNWQHDTMTRWPDERPAA